MRGLVIYAFILTGVFYFSEGKPCPENTRPHKTRCDSYYKCRTLPNSSHVWVPIKCNEGLVYEHNLGACVVAGEDWECLTASELATTSTSKPNNAKKDQSDILILNENDADLLMNDSAHSLHKNDDNNVEIVVGGTLSSEEQDDNIILINKPELRTVEDSAVENESESQQIGAVSQFDSSGDGELVDLDGSSASPPENREEDVVKKPTATPAGSTKPTYHPAVQALEAELKQSVDMDINGSSKPGSPIDPKLTAHLQRLSQLIDGLKETYQKTDAPQTDMRPDQLNAFLAHFDLKNRFDMLNPESTYKATPISSTTAAPQIATTDRLPVPSVNKTLLQEHLSNKHMKPETKVVLTNALPPGFGLTQGGTTAPGYASSQIVVNRPEGSVLFTMPQYGPMPPEQPHVSSHEYNEPKISEETLKTVLELSKQMIAAQNVPKVIPNGGYNQAYYTPQFLQPLILSPQNPGMPYQHFYAPSMPSTGYENMPQYSNSPSTGHLHKKHHHSSASSNNGYKPSTTIIHNNVIPVHVTTTNSGEKELLDAYGNSLGVYPPLPPMKPTGEQQESSNKFVASVTTARPTISVTTMATRISGQFATPTPYAEEYMLTTPRPFDHQPSPATVAGFYTPSPHLSDRNVNRVFQTESYPTLNMGNMPRPMDLDSGYQMSAHSGGPQMSGGGGGGGMLTASYANHGLLFPAQLDASQVKIRPNSQKIESMEVDADEVINANYVNSNVNTNHANHNHHNHNVKHVLTYSSNLDGSSDLSQQLAPGSYVEHSYSTNTAAKNPFIAPQPTISTSIYDSTGNMDVNVFNAGGGGGSSGLTSSLTLNNRPKIPLNMHSSPHQLVNFDGSFMSLDVFQKSILPLMTRSPSSLAELGKVEVITCQTGVRQPNVTDCTRYFVCSKKDGKVLSYSCPPYTGFNTQTRICDAQTYAHCRNEPLLSGYSIAENKRLQMEALNVIAAAKRRQEAALKAQDLAHLLQQFGTASGMSGSSNEATLTMPQAHESPISSNVDTDALSSYMQNIPVIVSSTTMRPAQSALSTSSVKKRKYYCREGDKIPDQTSITSYFVCYKNADGQMKGHKMTCSKGLLFCPKTLMCTLASKCS